MERQIEFETERQIEFETGREIESERRDVETAVQGKISAPPKKFAGQSPANFFGDHGRPWRGGLGGRSPAQPKTERANKQKIEKLF